LPAPAPRMTVLVPARRPSPGPPIAPKKPPMSLRPISPR
jgi:hypothetical protein